MQCLHFARPSSEKSEHEKEGRKFLPSSLPQAVRYESQNCYRRKRQQNENQVGQPFFQQSHHREVSIGISSSIASFRKSRNSEYLPRKYSASLRGSFSKLFSKSDSRSSNISRTFSIRLTGS